MCSGLYSSSLLVTSGEFYYSDSGFAELNSVAQHAMPPEFDGKWKTEVSNWGRNVLTLGSQVSCAYPAMCRILRYKIHSMTCKRVCVKFIIPRYKLNKYVNYKPLTQTHTYVNVTDRDSCDRNHKDLNHNHTKGFF